MVQLVSRHGVGAGLFPGRTTRRVRGSRPATAPQRSRPIHSSPAGAAAGLFAGADARRHARFRSHRPAPGPALSYSTPGTTSLADCGLETRRVGAAAGLDPVSRKSGHAGPLRPANHNRRRVLPRCVAGQINTDLSARTGTAIVLRHRRRGLRSRRRNHRLPAGRSRAGGVLDRGRPLFAVGFVPSVFPDGDGAKISPWRADRGLGRRQDRLCGGPLRGRRQRNQQRPLPPHAARNPGALAPRISGRSPDGKRSGPFVCTQRARFIRVKTDGPGAGGFDETP
ncbi:MAG: hypothetical protein BWX84_02761 [Verrucomicrobia bacterium ADurb.Bin118]|nr:MAG: hypothetical protein BWX84_02761 [Verrucomicrobia bacterium ADurb.Bin118]